VRRHQDGEVDDAVLLCTNQLVAIDQQNLAVPLVIEQQVRHIARLGDLQYPGSFLRKGLVERDVVRFPPGCAQQRDER